MVFNANIVTEKQNRAKDSIKLMGGGEKCSDEIKMDYSRAASTLASLNNWGEKVQNRLF